MFPGQLAGLLAALVGMVFGSLAPQWVENRQDTHRPHPGMHDEKAHRPAH
jgi:hypothetical protein